MIGEKLKLGDPDLAFRSFGLFRTVPVRGVGCGGPRWAGWPVGCVPVPVPVPVPVIFFPSFLFQCVSMFFTNFLLIVESSDTAVVLFVFQGSQMG